jgi:hypothetical protein
MAANPEDLVGEYRTEGRSEVETLSLKADGTATLAVGPQIEYFRWTTGEVEPGCLRIHFEPIGTATEWHPCADKTFRGVFVSHRSDMDYSYYKPSGS